MAGGGDKREPVGVVYVNQINVRVGLDDCRWRGFVFGIGRLTVAASQQIGAETKQDRGRMPETD
jgi:hypothetical protein